MCEATACGARQGRVHPPIAVFERDLRTVVRRANFTAVRLPTLAACGHDTLALDEDRPRSRAPRARPGRRGGSSPALDAGRHGQSHWLDLELARRRAHRRPIPNLAHDSVLHRQPVTTLDDHLARGLRVEALASWSSRFDARGADRPTTTPCWTPADLRFGPPILRPPSLRDFYAFEGHVATMWERRGARGARRPGIACRSSTSATSRRSAAPTSRSGRRRLSASSTTSSRSRPSSTRRRATSRGPGGGGDRRLHDLQRLVRPRPAARRDDRPARAGQGQGLRVIDRAVARDAGRAGRRAEGRSDRSRPRDDGGGERHRDVARAAGPTPSSASARCSRERRPTSGSDPAT